MEDATHELKENGGSDFLLFRHPSVCDDRRSTGRVLFFLNAGSLSGPSTLDHVNGKATLEQAVDVFGGENTTDLSEEETFGYGGNESSTSRVQTQQHNRNRNTPWTTS